MYFYRNILIFWFFILATSESTLNQESLGVNSFHFGRAEPTDSSITSPPLPDISSDGQILFRNPSAHVDENNYNKFDTSSPHLITAIITIPNQEPEKNEKVNHKLQKEREKNKESCLSGTMNSLISSGIKSFVVIDLNSFSMKSSAVSPLYVPFFHRLQSSETEEGLMGTALIGRTRTEIEEIAQETRSNSENEETDKKQEEKKQEEKIQIELNGRVYLIPATHRSHFYLLLSSGDTLENGKELINFCQTNLQSQNSQEVPSQNSVFLMQRRDVSQNEFFPDVSLSSLTYVPSLFQHSSAQKPLQILVGWNEVVDNIMNHPDPSQNPSIVVWKTLINRPSLCTFNLRNENTCSLDYELLTKIQTKLLDKEENRENRELLETGNSLRLRFYESECLFCMNKGREALEVLREIKELVLTRSQQRSLTFEEKVFLFESIFRTARILSQLETPWATVLETLMDSASSLARSEVFWILSRKFSLASQFTLSNMFSSFALEHCYYEKFLPFSVISPSQSEELCAVHLPELISISAWPMEEFDLGEYHSILAAGNSFNMDPNKRTSFSYEQSAEEEKDSGESEQEKSENKRKQDEKQSYRNRLLSNMRLYIDQLNSLEENLYAIPKHSLSDIGYMRESGRERQQMSEFLVSLTDFGSASKYQMDALLKYSESNNVEYLINDIMYSVSYLSNPVFWSTRNVIGMWMAQAYHLRLQMYIHQERQDKNYDSVKHRYREKYVSQIEKPVIGIYCIELNAEYLWDRSENYQNSEMTKEQKMLVDVSRQLQEVGYQVQIFADIQDVGTDNSGVEWIHFSEYHLYSHDIFISWRSFNPISDAKFKYLWVFEDQKTQELRSFLGQKVVCREIDGILLVSGELLEWLPPTAHAIAVPMKDAEESNDRLQKLVSGWIERFDTDLKRHLKPENSEQLSLREKFTQVKQWNAIHERSNSFKLFYVSCSLLDSRQLSASLKLFHHSIMELKKERKNRW